ncbi:MAG: hypothetical protein Q7J34_12325 [Bacteroidales bacterium]|nr:hypothetical protein [Bacteroidales bacterium]
MKKQVVIFCLILISFSAYSQEYFKFPDADALWNFKITGSLGIPHEWPVTDSLGQKIVINTFEYSEVFRAAEGNIWLLGAIREDTAARKVFFHNFSNEILLYDFKGGSKNSFFSKFSERYQEPVTISCENDIQMKDKSL